MLSIVKIAPLLISIVLLIVSCKTVTEQQESDVPERPIEEVLAKYTDELMSIPGVVGVAQGLLNDKPCITVLVIQNTPELKKKIPKSLKGYPVVIEETGEIRALPE
ncbi:MAG: hypothetical protein ACPL7B_05475 [Candidatus Poribacteria bacterium]